MVPYTPLFINGEERQSGTGESFDVISSATGHIVGQSASASAEDCKAAVDTAAEAFKTWKNTTIFERRDIFLKAADLVATKKYEIKIRESTHEETAASEAWSNFNWFNARSALHNIVGLLSDMSGTTLPSAIPGAKADVQRRAIGVILSIAPWNAPFMLSLRAVGIPILCGNTVVLKSSEYSPRSQALVAELFQEAGLPKGVLNYISVARKNAPARTAELIGHPMVRKITFTGSDKVGRIIASEAAKYLKPCIFELGGKAPVVVLNDADVTSAAQAIVHGSLLHSGQICMSSERVIAQSKVAPRLIEAVKQSYMKIKAGSDPKDPSIKLSPLFTEQSAENVVKMVKEAVDGGATLIHGDLQRQGSVLQPHLIQDVKKEARLWKDESFGPVVVFATVNTIEEAIELANASEYSLTSSVWTTNLYSADQVASGLRTGYVHINGSTIHAEPLAGLRGVGGASGYGRFDVDAFTDLQVVVTHPPGRALSI